MMSNDGKVQSKTEYAGEIHLRNEAVNDIALKELHPFPDHPFQVRNDMSMQEMIESIRKYGVLTPVIVRPHEDGGYEVVSGHRRKFACEAAGLKTIPAVIRNLTQDEAIIMMVDSNLQLEDILPSEKAKAYQMKLEAIKRQGLRTDLTSVQVGQKLPSKTSREIIAANSADSSTQIQRYIRLTKLEPKIQKMVDDNKIGMTPAVEISYLKPEEQSLLLETMESEQATPSLSQAQRLKKLSQEGKLNDDTMLDIMMEQKKPDNSTIVFTEEKLRRYFPRSFTPLQMEKTIYQLLERWQKQRQRQQER